MWVAILIGKQENENKYRDRENTKCTEKVNEEIILQSYNKGVS